MLIYFCGHSKSFIVRIIVRIKIFSSLIRADEVFPPFISGMCMFQLVRKRGTPNVTNLLWQDKYTEAMLELNPEELPAKSAVAEEAVNQRIEEIKLSNEGSEEEQWALGDALRGLRLLAQAECQARSPKLDRRQWQEAP